AAFRGSKLVAVFPEDDADAALARIRHDIFQLGFRPARPEAFEQVVFEAQARGEVGPLLHSFGSVIAAIEIAPERAAGPDPWGLESFGKKSGVGRRGDV